MAKRNRETETTRSQGEKILRVQFSGPQSSKVTSQVKEEPRIRNYIGTKGVTTREFAKIKGQSPAPEQGGRKETLPLSVFLRRHLHLQSR